MQILINTSSERPVYQQIIDRVKRDVAQGLLQKGDKLPTVRYLATQLAINPNTIAKAYQLLELEGIITTRPGAGTFIAGNDNQLSAAVREKLLREQMERLAVEAVHMQVDQETLSRWFSETCAKFNFPEKS